MHEPRATTRILARDTVVIQADCIAPGRSAEGGVSNDLILVATRISPARKSARGRAERTPKCTLGAAAEPTEAEAREDISAPTRPAREEGFVARRIPPAERV